MADPFVWTPENCATLRRLKKDNLSSSEIGKIMGISRNAVIGKVRRMHLAKEGIDRGAFSIMWERGVTASALMHYFGFKSASQVKMCAQQLGLPERPFKAWMVPKQVTPITKKKRPEEIFTKPIRAPVVVAGDKCPLCPSLKVPGAPACYSHVYFMRFA